MASKYVNLSDDEETNLPSSEQCQELVEQFTLISNTDEALAQFFLQDHDWSLDKAVDAYYNAQKVESRSKNNISRNAQELESKNETKFSSNVEEIILSPQANSSNSVLRNTTKTPASLLQNMTTEPPDTFRLLSWNLDGLDEKNLKKRTKAVIKIIQIEKPDIVFLQEVIPITYSYIVERLPEYNAVAGGTHDYFTATLILSTTVHIDSHKIIPFENTLMLRNILQVQCHIGKLKLSLMNSHLESTADHANQRIEQFKMLVQFAKNCQSDETCIFGGDLNIRDKEVITANVPKNIEDLWISCGSRPECKFTWDLKRNTNKSFPGKFQPQMRFDRLYLRNAKTTASVNPKHFGLVGIQRVSGTQSFPSDHWGVIATFDILNLK